MCDENICLVGYHGSEIKRANKILDNKAMIPSIGDKHWLGNGSYFYKDDFYAFKWIKDMFKHKYECEYKTKKELTNKYGIISIKLSIKENRIFNLENNPIHKSIMDYAYNKFSDKKEYSKRFRNVDFVDGVVINILFDILNYNKQYDLVISTFPINKSRYRHSKLRLDYLPETQYCVKNDNIIEFNCLLDLNNLIDNYESIIRKIYNGCTENELYKFSYNKNKFKL